MWIYNENIRLIYWSKFNKRNYFLPSKNYFLKEIFIFKTEIEKWLEYVCEALPSTIKDECKSFVTEYEPIIAALVSSRIPLDKVCQYVKVCPQSDDFSVELSKEMEEKINSIEMSKFEVNKKWKVKRRI